MSAIETTLVEAVSAETTPADPGRPSGTSGTGKPGQPGQPTRRRELRSGWGTGRGTQPQARPARPVGAPTLEPVPVAVAQSCRVARPATASPLPTGATGAAAGGWRLTDRGVALVLAIGLALAAAALVVVSLTALRITSDTYVPSGLLTTH